MRENLWAEMSSKCVISRHERFWCMDYHTMMVSVVWFITSWWFKLHNYNGFFVLSLSHHDGFRCKVNHTLVVCHYMMVSIKCFVILWWCMVIRLWWFQVYCLLHHDGFRCMNITPQWFCKVYCLSHNDGSKCMVYHTMMAMN